MQVRVKTSSGAVVLLIGLPALAQPASHAGVGSIPASGAGDNVVHVGDPSWFIAGLVTGLVVGAVAGKVFGGSKSNSNS